MSKNYRSLLWSGLVVAGVAACGDDVTIAPPPAPPAATVHSVSVAPNGATVGIGANVITMVASVNADAGVATTVTWRSGDASKATVSTAGVVTTLAAGSVGIEACSTVNAAVCGNATLTITAAPVATVTSVTVTPGAPTILKSTTLQLVAAVTGTNGPSQTVTWQTSPNAAVATVSNTGLVTAVGGGTTSITACSTVAGFTNVCGSAAVTVVVPSPAVIQIEKITESDLLTPVTLSNVSGQIEISLNIENGGFTVTKAQALIGNKVVAEQIFTASPSAAAGDGPAKVLTSVVLSTNTRQVRKLSNGLYVPVVFNGPQAVTAQIFVAGSATPISSNAIPVVMQNADAWVPNSTPVLTPANPLPTFTTTGPVVWYRSNINFVGGANYISFYPVTPEITFDSNICGTSNDAVVGTYSTGIKFAGTFTCSSPAEGAVSISDPVGDVTEGTAPAADVIYISADDEDTEQVGTVYTVNADSRYNLLDGSSLDSGNGVNVDYKAPVASWLPIGFLSGGAAPNNCETTGITPGCWINNSYNLKNRLVVTDAGTGENASARAIYTWIATGTSPFYACLAALPTGTGADFAETTVTNSYQVCGSSADNIGNVSNFPASNRFSNDNTAPTLVYSGTYPVATVNPAEVNVLPGAGTETLNYTLTDNNSGVDATVGLAVTFTRLLNTAAFPAAGVASAVACSNPVNTLTGSGVTPQTMLTPYLISTCTLPGERKWSAIGKDRAGNSAGPIARQLEYNPLAPVVNAVNIIPNYAAATAINLDVLATDDEDLKSGEMWVHTTTNLGSHLRLIFGPKGGFFSGIWGADWDASLFFATTLGTTARLSLPATYSLAGVVESAAAGPTQLQSAIDTLGVQVYDTWGAASGVTVVPLNSAFVVTTSYASSNPWTASLASVVAPALVTSGTTCGFEYATPTNNPEIISRAWIVSEAAATNDFTVLLDLNTAPALVSDNGIQRLYRHSISGAQTCAAYGATNIIAIKSNVGVTLLSWLP